jgi:hypothetical protein
LKKARRPRGTVGGRPRAYPVLVAELDPEGVLDGLRGGAVAAAGVAHEDEHVLGAVGAELDELDGALLLLPEGLVVVLGAVERGGGGGRALPRGGELPGVGEALAQPAPRPLLVVVRRHGLQHRLPDRPPPRRRRHRGARGARRRVRKGEGGWLADRRRGGRRVGRREKGVFKIGGSAEGRVRAGAAGENNWNWRLLLSRVSCAVWFRLFLS